ncbi:glycosyltransferase family 9 protein [Flavobacterium amniphilum]|uniref:glycosyltransferase family 9 protein n=1 Tax=Flavobacterium amniphilum TaxID=1834035 RepID=UPI00202A6DD2|nr:glycosyltransferase family 9 protein [Flavobacterium amniphilum]MCL9805679.1 glycosyltransferase family 9 protein [Flavobacterium amniphilum]
MKVLVIQQKMIGDVLASTVICETIKTIHPDWELHYMIEPSTLAVVENNPFIDHIVFFEKAKHNGLNSLIGFGKELRKENYDAVIDAYGKWESIIPAYFSGAKTRIGNQKWYTKLLFTETIIPKKNIEGSAIAHRLQLAETLVGNNSSVAFPKIYLTDAEITSAQKSIQEKLDTARPIFMISVLGSGSNKSLPAEQMAQTLDDIAAANNSIQLLFNFMPNQEAEAKAIYDACQPETQQQIVFDFYTKGLRTFLAVLSQCDAMIGNEGGAVNMAKALNIPTFTIFSPWINKSSWNMLTDDENHVAVHLNDYHPEIYNGQHSKHFKKQAMDLYKKLTPDLYRAPLIDFIKRITS